MKPKKSSQNQLKLSFSAKPVSFQQETPSNKINEGRIVTFDPRQDIYKKILNRKME